MSRLGDLLIVFFGDWYLYIVLLIFGYSAAREYQKGSMAAMYSYLTALIAALVARFGVAEVIRIFYHRPRPFLALGVSHLINDSSYSFPSGHTILIFALGVATHFFNKRLAYFLYISGVVIGIARVMGGVHYPSDILGGIILGLITGVAVYSIARTVLNLKI